MYWETFLLEDGMINWRGLGELILFGFLLLILHPVECQEWEVHPLYIELEDRHKQTQYSKASIPLKQRLYLTGCSLGTHKLYWECLIWGQQPYVVQICQLVAYCHTPPTYAGLQKRCYWQCMVCCQIDYWKQCSVPCKMGTNHVPSFVGILHSLMFEIAQASVSSYL